MEKKDKRIYFDVFDLNGNKIENQVRPDGGSYLKYHNNRNYVLKCYKCGGEGQIIERRKKHRYDKYNYYFRANHTEECGIAKEGKQKNVIITENLVLNFSVSPSKNEEGPGSEEPGLQKKSKTNRELKGTKHIKGDSQQKTITKDLYNMIVDCYDTEKIWVKDNGAKVKKDVKDIVISASKDESYRGKRFNGNYIIVDFLDSDYIEDEYKEDKTCIIAFSQGKHHKEEGRVLVKLHFLYEKDYDEFIQKKLALKETRRINSENYNKWKKGLEKKYNKIQKIIPVFAVDLKYNYELSQQKYVSKAYDANVTSGNIIWISEEEAI